MHWPLFSIWVASRVAAWTWGVNAVATMVLGPPVDAKVAGSSALTCAATYGQETSKGKTQTGVLF